MRYNRITPGLIIASSPTNEWISKRPIQDEAMEKRSPILGFLEYLAEGVMILDSERIIRAVNSSLERMLGWSASELFGVRCQDIFDCQHPITSTSLCSNLRPLLVLHSGDFLNHPVHYQEISIATKSGERREVSASFASF